MRNGRSPARLGRSGLLTPREIDRSLPITPGIMEPRKTSVGFHGSPVSIRTPDIKQAGFDNVAQRR